MNNSATSNSNNNRSIEYAITCSDATGQEELDGIRGSLACDMRYEALNIDYREIDSS